MSSKASMALASLCRSYWAFQCDEFPIIAMMASQPVAHDELLREAPADHWRRSGFAQSMLGELALIPVDMLDNQERVSHAMLRRDLQALVDAVALQAHLRPSLFPMGPDFVMIYSAGLVVLQSQDDARRWLARLRRMPASLHSVIDSLAAGVEAGIRYPRLVLARACAQTMGQMSMAPALSPLFGPFTKAGDRAAPSGVFADIASDALQTIEHAVYPALRAYAACLREQLGAVARDTLSCCDSPNGAAFYREQIRQNTTQDLQAQDVHHTGLAEVQRIDAQMQAVAAWAGFAGDLPGYMQHLKDDPDQLVESGEQLLEQMQILSKRIDAKLPEYFGHLPRSSYGVELIPRALAEKMPTAYAQASPADHSAAGTYWITSLPAKCPRYTHLPLALHEGWPGHLMHLALMQELDGLPDFRRYGADRYSACLEGWAMYCERLGEEMGFYDTPDKLYGRLEMEMERALRLVVDTGIHAQGWSREQAIELMMEHMAAPLATIEAEVDRFIGWPGQALAYQIGNRKFCDLRARAEARLGGRFNRRAFHDALMAAGPVTLDVLDEHIEAWIAEGVRCTPVQTV